MDFPKLRRVNIFPVQTSGQTLVCLQDPQNISETALFLTPAVYFIVSLMDGQHSILDIQAAYMRRFGEILYREKIQEVVKQLEENLFLEGERFEEALREARERFRASAVREAAFAGKSYADEPERLRTQIEGYFTGPDGPGPVGEKTRGDDLKGVIAPHVDFQRGGICYAFAHREIGERNSADSFIVLGTAHTFTEHPFCLTRKGYRTPLGTLPTDQELIDEIESRCHDDLFKDEVVHRSEHSIEFQCVFLRYLYPDPAPLRIVPILCGSFQEAIERGISPMEMEPVRSFIEALRESVSSLGRRVCYIASADLAHMGLQFGDPGGIREYDLGVLAQDDQAMLAHIERLDAEGFFSSIARERDRRRICGLPAIYTLLKTMVANEGKLLRYGQAFTPDTESVVTFASLAFY